MKTFPWATIPGITTARLCLREIVDDDAADIFRFRSDAEVQQFNTLPMRSIYEAHLLVRTMRHWFRTGQAIQWGITLRDEDHVVGICGLHDWRPDQHRAMLGYDLVREHWGQGLAQEAMRDVLRLGFEQLGLIRIEAVTVVDNVRSVRLLERLGFRCESGHPEPLPADDGTTRGSATYSLVRSEYEQRARPSDEPPTAAPAP